jgi:hypothetical protein
MIEFNFDEWSELYKTDPIAFENKRQELLEAEIMKAPIEYRGRLHLLQLECDIISLTKNPLDATKKMFEMSLQHLNKLEQTMAKLEKEIDK